MEVYGLRIKGEGNTYREWIRQRIRCPYCNADLAAGYLASYRHYQQGVDQGDLGDPPPTPR